MRVLMLCTKYPLDPNDRFMTNELAGALVAAGHRVQVVVTDWNAPFGAPTRSVRSEDGVDAIVIAPRRIAGLGRFAERASKWTLSSLFALREMRKALGQQSFDLLVCFTPCVTVAAQLIWATRRWPMRSTLFVHDFFPHHHRSIGLVPAGPVFEIARRLEEYLIRKFHVIGCIWPDNIVYLRKHHRVRPEQRAIWTPLWGEIAPPPPRSKEVTRTQHGLPLDRKIVVFGGQITEGRGVEEMLQAAAMARDARPDLAFLLIGEGRLVELVEEHIASGGSNVIYRRRIPRADYLGLISACDLGLVCTVAGVASSSFPSKTIDYLRAGLPIVAAVEQDSDYRDFLRRWNIGISIPAGNATALFAAVTRAVDEREMTANIARNARACLEEVFDVKSAVKRLLDAIEPVEPTAVASPDFHAAIDR
jgi:glycosyltransferase involved in cell wall biosynthesis